MTMLGLEVHHLNLPNHHSDKQEVQNRQNTTHRATGESTERQTKAPRSARCRDGQPSQGNWRETTARGEPGQDEPQGFGNTLGYSACPSNSGLKAVVRAPNELHSK